MTSSDPGSFVSVQAFLDQAIALEVASAAFYGALQLQTSGAARELMVMLEKQERAHEAILRGFGAPDTAAMMRFPPDLLAAMPPPPPAGAALETLLDHAIQRERRALELYWQASRQVTGTFKELVEGLARFEEEHEGRLISLRRM